jgi:ribose 1,5-bisphosphokinase
MDETSPSPAGTPQSFGTMIVVVGPSGAGKDTLMALAAEHFHGRDEVHFVRRVITRSHDAGGEAHESVSDTEFDVREKSGRFAVSWHAHGLKYGIPVETLDRLASGHLVIANGSRSALSHFRPVFPNVKVLNITARHEVLAARLEQRGRETREDILRRLQRSSMAFSADFEVIDIDNSGALEEASAAVIAMIEAQTFSASKESQLHPQSDGLDNP